MPEMHASPGSSIKPDARAVVASAMGVGVIRMLSIALYESIMAPFSYASKPALRSWLSWTRRDAVETFMVAPGSTVALTLLEGVSIQALTMIGLLPSFVATMVSWSPAHSGDENTLRGTGLGVTTFCSSTRAVGEGAKV